MKISRNALGLILRAARGFYPDEFGGLLRGEGDRITEVLMIPASTYGDGFVQTRMDMVPMDRTIIGSVHSHPGGDFRPSGADLAFFKRIGYVHLITRKPYRGLGDVAAYDMDGHRLKLTEFD